MLPQPNMRTSWFMKIVSTHNVEVDEVALIRGKPTKWCVVMREVLPGAVVIIGHDAKHVEVPDETFSVVGRVNGGLARGEGGGHYEAVLVKLRTELVQEHDKVLL